MAKRITGECITVALETLGCKVNQAETELISRELREAGCRIVSPGEKADIYILNTCTVTHIADRKSRHLLRMAHRKNPDARIIAIGCYAERSPEKLTEIEGVDLAAGNGVKVNLVNVLREKGYLRPETTGLTEEHHNRTRSFIKAQDGCNNFCTYCIVPLARGQEKSLPPEQVIQEVRRRAADGYQEVVLTGTEIGRYRYESLDLKGLLERILAETEITRLRLSSLQPQEISTGLLRLWQDPRLCRHFHLSLQSGSDTVLRRMNRRYSSREYAEAIDIIRSGSPDAAITTDIIVGFPGETQQEFRESYEFCRRMEFARIHVFPYSPREGTAAARMPEQVSDGEKKPRSEMMLSLAKAGLQAFCRRFTGQSLPVLFEQRSGIYWTGLTDNYIKVYTESKESLANRIVTVRLVEMRGEGMRGENEFLASSFKLQVASFGERGLEAGNWQLEL